MSLGGAEKLQLKILLSSRYWNNLKNFNEIINYLSKENFTLIASAR